MRYLHRDIVHGQRIQGPGRALCNGFLRPSYVKELTLGWIELHIPQPLHLLEFTQGILKGSRVFLSLHCQVHRSIVRKETNLEMGMVGQVIDIKQNKYGTQDRPLWNPGGNWEL